MNEKGEITLLSSVLLMIFMSIVILCGLELRKSYLLLQKRTHLFLCAKETKGELQNFLTFMGRTNWGIKNTKRAALLAAFIPGLQGLTLKAHKLKKFLQRAQDLRALSFLKSMHSLEKRKCPLDPRIFKTPFRLGTNFLLRDSEGAVELREVKWSYLFYSSPYLLQLQIKAEGWEKLKPNVGFESLEKGATLSSLWSSH